MNKTIREAFSFACSHTGGGWRCEGGSSNGGVPRRPFQTMAEAEKARLKLAKQDRKEANELLVAVAGKGQQIYEILNFLFINEVTPSGAEFFSQTY